MKYREPVAAVWLSLKRGQKGASDQWKLSQKLVVSMVKDQLKCDAPRLGFGSDVLDLPAPANSHHQDDYNFSRESL